MRKLPIRPPETLATEEPGPWQAVLFQVLYYPASGHSKLLVGYVNYN